MLDKRGIYITIYNICEGKRFGIRHLDVRKVDIFVWKRMGESEMFMRGKEYIHII